MNKRLRKRYRKELLQKSKQINDGYVYGNCPMCFNTDKSLIQSVYGDDGYWHCDRCKEKWTVTA